MSKEAPQKYLGNGNHNWEPVIVEPVVTAAVIRLRVPGGWIYAQRGGWAVFVPMPDAVKHEV